MNLGRTGAVFLKELIHVRRDPHSLIQVILLPLVMLLIYGYALTFDVRLVPFTVYDQDGGPQVQELLSRFEGVPDVHHLGRLGSLRGDQYPKVAAAFGGTLNVPHRGSGRYLSGNSGACGQHIIHSQRLQTDDA